MTRLKDLNQDRLHGFYWAPRLRIQRTLCLLSPYFFSTLWILLVLTSPLHYVTNRENFGRLSMTFREHRLTECTLLLTDSCNAFSQ